MEKIKFNGIKFPFSSKSIYKPFIDLNINEYESVKSDLIHLIFTPEGQRLRNPKFGTKIIQFIFNPNDKQTWESVVNEIKEKVNLYIPKCIIEDIKVYESSGGTNLFVELKYKVKGDNGTITENVVLSI